MLLAIAMGLVLVFWGGYRLAKRFAIVGTIASLLLLAGARLLMRLNLGSPVEPGTPTGAGIVILLAFVLGFAAFTSYAVYRSTPGARRRDLEAFIENMPRGAQQSPWAAGYGWALENRVVSDAECKSEIPAYIQGCQDGIRKHRLRQAK